MLGRCLSARNLQGALEWRTARPVGQVPSPVQPAATARELGIVASIKNNFGFIRQAASDCCQCFLKLLGLCIFRKSLQRPQIADCMPLISIRQALSGSSFRNIACLAGISCSSCICCINKRGDLLSDSINAMLPCLFMRPNKWVLIQLWLFSSSQLSGHNLGGRICQENV